MTQPNKHADGQLSGTAGEFFVAAELLKRGVQTSVTFGSARAIDLLAHSPETGRSFTIQVKTVRENNYFLIGPGQVAPGHVYAFVLLNKPGQHPRYFIVPGHDSVDDPERFGKGFADPRLPCILPSDLEPYEDNWAIFGAAP